MAGWVEYLLRTEHMLIMCAVWIALGAVQTIWPRLARDQRWVRALPLLPIVGCSALVWAPGLVDGEPVEKVLLGVVLGALCGHAWKIAKQTMLGNDKRIRDHPTGL